MVGTALFLLMLVVLMLVLVAIVLLPVMAIGYYFWKWQLPGTRRRALMQPDEALLCRLENTNR